MEEPMKVNKLNTKGIIHRAGEEEFTENRKLTRSEIKELDKIANMPMPEKDRLYFIDYKIN